MNKLDLGGRVAIVTGGARGIGYAAAERYLALKTEADRLSDLLDTAKAALIALAEQPSEFGFGVTVTRFWKQGSVDYKKVPELKGVDLNPYRANGREEVRVGVAK